MVLDQQNADDDSNINNADFCQTTIQHANSNNANVILTTTVSVTATTIITTTTATTTTTTTTAATNSNISSKKKTKKFKDEESRKKWEETMKNKRKKVFTSMAKKELSKHHRVKMNKHKEMLLQCKRVAQQCLKYGRQKAVCNRRRVIVFHDEKIWPSPNSSRKIQLYPGVFLF